jgi:3'(2'), 5'-bisphosphate nucleotidase
MRWRHPQLSFAVDLVRDCSRLARQVQQAARTAAIEKDDRSPVTVADFSVQALAARRISLYSPQIPLVAEESAVLLKNPAAAPLLEQIAAHVGEFEPEIDPAQILNWIDRGQGQTSERFWVLDPVDGTKGFLRDAQYAVALALVEGGSVTLGVLGCPRLDLDLTQQAGPETLGTRGCLVAAARGEGTWAAPLEDSDFRPLRVSAVADPRLARVLRSVEGGHTNLDQMDRLLVELGIHKPPAAVDSQAKYALLAAGCGDFLTRLVSAEKPDYREKIWDQAAGTLAVEEAGGMVTDLDGRTLDFTAGRKLLRNRGIVASNGLLHQAVLTALAKVEGR